MVTSVGFSSSSIYEKYERIEDNTTNNYHEVQYYVTTYYFSVKSTNDP